MKKKKIKQLVRDLDNDCIEYENQLAAKVTVLREYEAALRTSEHRVNLCTGTLRQKNQRIAQLEAKCAAAVQLMQAATDRITQNETALAAHWENVGAYVERAKRVEAAADALREAGIGLGTAAFDIEKFVDATSAYDEAKGPGRLATSPPGFVRIDPWAKDDPGIPGTPVPRPETQGIL